MKMVDEAIQRALIPFIERLNAEIVKINADQHRFQKDVWNHANERLSDMSEAGKKRSEYILDQLNGLHGDPAHVEKQTQAQIDALSRIANCLERMEKKAHFS